MMTSSNGTIFRVTGPLCGVPVNSPHKGQWRGALMFPLICAWIHDWVNNREAGDLRRYRGHYDVNVMISLEIKGIYYELKYHDNFTSNDADQYASPYYVRSSYFETIVLLVLWYVYVHEVCCSVELGLLTTVHIDSIVAVFMCIDMPDVGN